MLRLVSLDKAGRRESAGRGVREAQGLIPSSSGQVLEQEGAHDQTDEAEDPGLGRGLHAWLGGAREPCGPHIGGRKAGCRALCRSGRLGAPLDRLPAGGPADPLFAFARSELGAPIACEISWQSFDGEDFGAIAFRFRDGSKLKYERQPPEVTIIDLAAARPLKLEPAKRALEKEYGAVVDWRRPPEVRREAGGEVRTYWHPEEGLNLGVDLVYRDGELRGIGFHSAP